MPGTWRNDPFSPSSPQKARPSVQPGDSSPVATSRPTAIGRSRPAPPFRMPEGAKLTVTRRSGQGRPDERTAARTRSRDSRTAASGRPTMVKPGNPLETWTSTETGRPTAPLSVAEATEASTTGERSHQSRLRSLPWFGEDQLATRVSSFGPQNHGTPGLDENPRDSANGGRPLPAPATAPRGCRSGWNPLARGARRQAHDHVSLGGEFTRANRRRRSGKPRSPRTRSSDHGRRSGEVEAIEGHDLVPSSDEVTDELLL